MSAMSSALKLLKEKSRWTRLVLTCKALDHFLAATVYFSNCSTLEVERSRDLSLLGVFEGLALDFGLGFAF